MVIKVPYSVVSVAYPDEAKKLVAEIDRHRGRARFRGGEHCDWHYVGRVSDYSGLDFYLNAATTDSERAAICRKYVKFGIRASSRGMKMTSKVLQAETRDICGELPLPIIKMLVLMADTKARKQLDGIVSVFLSSLMEMEEDTECDKCRKWVRKYMEAIETVRHLACNEIKSARTLVQTEIKTILESAKSVDCDPTDFDSVADAVLGK